jgi:hypothetical protein
MRCCDRASSNFFSRFDSAWEFEAITVGTHKVCYIKGSFVMGTFLLIVKH